MSLHNLIITIGENQSICVLLHCSILIYFSCNPVPCDIVYVETTKKILREKIKVDLPLVSKLYDLLVASVQELNAWIDKNFSKVKNPPVMPRLRY